MSLPGDLPIVPEPSLILLTNDDGGDAPPAWPRSGSRPGGWATAG